MGGALLDAELVDVAGMVGLSDAKITHRYDCYEGTSAKAKLPADFDVHGANLFARKPVRRP